MTSEPKAFASLSSGLLARKGAARPAMRPQGFGQAGASLDDLGWNDMGHEPQRPLLTPVLAADEFPLGANQPAPLSRTPLAGLTPVSPVHDQQAEIEERFGQPDEAEEQAGSTQAQPAQDEDETSEYGQDFREDDQQPLELSDPLPAAWPEQPGREAVPTAPVVEQALTPTAKPAPKRSRQPRSDQVAKDKAAFTLRLDPSRHLKLRLACAVNAKSAQQLVTRALDALLSSMPEVEAMASQAPERGSRKGQA
ncbi:MAG: FIG00636556: hypothetical protein [uncultured Sphingomonas sp.]|uniref:Uncharacterized protein n=2 Tax=uncultured Sphingomonas sp. TaxID=158754 RepID=A0A6J4TPG5_9SPHN|nr:MAG: FIG00636556: hypothetical protein [uncultured Sphingomonas sp.]